MRFFLLLGLLFVLSACGVADYEANMSITGWSKTVTLVSYDPDTRASMQADFTGVDGASTFTVSFEIMDDTVGDPATSPFICPMALLTWSVEGNSVSRVISVRSGTSITGVGEHVVVQLWDDARSIIIGNPIPVTGLQSYRVSVNISPGVRGPAEVGAVIVPYMYSNDGLVPPVVFYQGMGIAVLSPGSSLNARIDIHREYPSANALFFTVAAGYTAVVDTNIRVDCFVKGGGVVGQEYTIRHQGLWLPLQPNIETVVFALNPAVLAGTFVISTFLGVDG